MIIKDTIPELDLEELQSVSGGSRSSGNLTCQVSLTYINNRNSFELRLFISPFLFAVCPVPVPAVCNI